MTYLGAVWLLGSTAGSGIFSRGLPGVETIIATLIVLKRASSPSPFSCAQRVQYISVNGLVVWPATKRPVSFLFVSFSAVDRASTVFILFYFVVSSRSRHSR